MVRNEKDPNPQSKFGDFRDRAQCSSETFENLTLPQRAGGLKFHTCQNIFALSFYVRSWHFSAEASPVTKKREEHRKCQLD
jgi:hypothetical protein